MPYSLVTQPLPDPFRNPGTPSSTEAVQITRVLPSSISTLPSAVEKKSGCIFTGPSWSEPRPSFLNFAPAQRAYCAKGKVTRKAELCPTDYFLEGDVV